jgi:hypothetical protein
MGMADWELKVVFSLIWRDLRTAQELGRGAGKSLFCVISTA